MKLPNAPSGKRRKPLAIAVGALVAQLAMPLFAQDTPEGPSAPVLEEIIVTSQKRAESLQEVPISVVALSGEKIEDAGIENLEDLTMYMPNIHFTESGFSTQVRVRGIGSGNSQGFEQSVGMYIDGIYYGRAQLFRTPFMDMERAELLRGPQTILFGKNSIAGALNLSTAKPTDFLTGKLTVSQEFETDQTEISGHISGPITDTLRGRLAVRTYEEDGFITNTHQDRDEPQSDEQSIRVSLDWTPTDNLSFYLKAQRDEFDVVGRAIEITQDVPLSEGGATYQQVLQVLGQPTIDGEHDYRRQTNTDEFSNNEVNNVTFSVEYGFNDHTLTLVSGLLDYTYDELCDCDFTPAEILPLALHEDYDQFSQEIRIASPVGQTFEWIGGAYYQTYDQEFSDDLSLTETNLLPNLQAPLAPLAGTGFLREFEQSSDSWALFAQGTWNATDKLHVTVGARYTEEEKSASKSLNIYDLDTGDISTSPLLGWLYLNVFQAENNQATLSFADPMNPTPLIFSGADVSHSRDESAFMPLLNVGYDFNDDVMAYASVTRGFKAGGFDPRSNQIGNYPTTDTSQTEEDPYRFFEFDEEEATSMEVGMKSTLADGRAEFNLAFYRTEYEDLQVSQFDGGVGFNVGNAKETLVQGIELDGRWLLYDGLTFGYGASYLDYEYEDFDGGNCYVGQVPDGADFTGDGEPDGCDYTGKRDVFTPEYTLNASLDYVTPINSWLTFAGFLDVQHVDSHQTHVNLDPTGEIDAYTMVNLRLGVEAENWGVALLGKNLLDEKVVTISSNAPLSDSNFATNTHYSFVRRPLTVALEGTVKF